VCVFDVVGLMYNLFLALTSISHTIDVKPNEKNWLRFYRVMYAQKQVTLRHQTKSSAIFHPTVFPLLPTSHPTHRVLFPDPSNGASAGFHPFPAGIYRPIPSGIFRKFYRMNTPSSFTVEQHVRVLVSCLFFELCQQTITTHCLYLFSFFLCRMKRYLLS
jgi:hypothetical protein